jgi:tetratricopeptide (TPR) repeat protein
MLTYSIGYSWLLIFDNVESWEILHRFWPPSYSGSVLITTRHQSIAELAENYEALQPFTESEAEDYLLNMIREMPSEKKVGAKAVANELGGLPLAMSQIAGFLSQTNCSCTQFLDIYQKRSIAREINNSTPSLVSFDYHFTLGTVWSLSMSVLPSTALALVEILAFLDPDMIEKAAGSSSELSQLNDLYQFANSRPTLCCWLLTYIRRRKVISELSSRSLISIGEGDSGDESLAISIHRLIQLDTLLKLDNILQRRELRFMQTCTMVRAGFPRQDLGKPMTNHWRLCAEYLPHASRLHSVFQTSNPTLEGNFQFAQLLGDVGYYLWEKGMNREALRYLNTSRIICEGLLDDFSVDKADVLNMIGLIQIEAGQPEISKGTAMMQRVLAIRRNCRDASDPVMDRVAFNANDMSVGNCISNMACAYNGLRDWNAAENATLQALDILRRHGTEESHPYDYAERYGNLGCTKAMLGNFDEAEKLCREACRLNEKGFGEKDLRSCMFRFYLANVTLQSGRLDEALQQHNLVLQSREECLGSSHPDIADSLYAVASIHYRKGQFEQARYVLAFFLSI